MSTRHIPCKVMQMNKKHFEMLKKGVVFWNENRPWYSLLEGSDLRGLDLSGYDLNCADLRSVNMSGSSLHSVDLGNTDLRGADLSCTCLVLTNFYKSSLIGATLRGANLISANLNSACLAKADLRGAKLPPPEEMLKCYWGKVSDGLCLELIRYDAANHPNPELFDKWAKGGDCPYMGTGIKRAADFYEERSLWSPGPSKSAEELMKMVIVEKCKDSDFHN